MQRLRRLSVTLLAAASLAGLPACSDDEAKNKADKAGEKVKSEAEKAKKDVDGQ